MKRITLLLALILVAPGILAACSRGGTKADPGTQAPAAGTQHTNISAAQLNSMLEKKDFLLVNVHVPYDGEIAQTDLFIPFDKVNDNLAQLPNNQARIVLYCRSGAMSATAANALVQSGYANVFNLEGGMYAWQDAGYEVIQKPQQ